MLESFALCRQTRGDGSITALMDEGFFTSLIQNVGGNSMVKQKIFTIYLTTTLFSLYRIPFNNNTFIYFCYDFKDKAENL